MELPCIETVLAGKHQTHLLMQLELTLFPCDKQVSEQVNY